MTEHKTGPIAGEFGGCCPWCGKPDAQCECIERDPGHGDRCQGKRCRREPCVKYLGRWLCREHYDKALVARFGRGVIG